MNFLKRIKTKKKITLAVIVFMIVAFIYGYSYKHYPLSSDVVFCGAPNERLIEKYSQACASRNLKDEQGITYQYQGAVCENGEWKYDTCYIASVKFGYGPPPDKYLASCGPLDVAQIQKFQENCEAVIKRSQEKHPEIYERRPDIYDENYGYLGPKCKDGVWIYNRCPVVEFGYGPPPEEREE